MARLSRSLEELAGLHGVLTSYVDAMGHPRRAAPEALTAVLRSLGAPLASPAGADAALAERRAELSARTLEPVVVVWNPEPRPALTLKLPRPRASGRYRVRIAFEEAGDRAVDGRLEDLRAVRTTRAGRATYVTLPLPLGGELPDGYHRLCVHLDDTVHEALLLAAPRKTWSPEKSRLWGAFVPTYSLQSARSLGIGDLADLQSVVDWTRTLGGDVVGTLPLLASFFDEPFEPSPYSPVSRRFWNEIYLALERLPEHGRCEAARRELESAELASEIEALRRALLVDYRRTMALKRRVLEKFSACFFEDAASAEAELGRFLSVNPDAHDYARFRAAVERQRRPWRTWPARLRDGRLEPGDYAEEAYRYHLYAQLRMHEQLESLAVRSRQGMLGLYLDLPLGVHPDGYDVWKERGSFLDGCWAGAPPDPIFTKGQSWGLTPLHPEQARADGYRYLADCLRHQLRLAGALRIDHVMSFHRIFCIPEGMDARDGVYVTFRSEELWAVAALESQRHRSMLVGEDLGTVPAEVREAMDSHGVSRMYVVQLELKPEPDALPEPPVGSVASLNTHDMPMFASFYGADDVTISRDLGLLDEAQAEAERTRRRAALAALRHRLRQHDASAGDDDARSVLRAVLAELADSPARMLLVTLEDAWLEAQPQNVPSSTNRPNWQRKMRYSLEEIQKHAEVLELLHDVDRGRRQPAFRGPEGE